MDGNKQQKTIPTVYNMSSSKVREVLWALEELADAGIKYNVVNLHRGRADTYKVLKSQFPLGKSPSVTLEHVNGESEVTY
jgi:glutathione S-transferase